jgi:hypothetical protein
MLREAPLILLREEPDGGSRLPRPPVAPAHGAADAQDIGTEAAPDIPASEPTDGFDRWLHAQIGRYTASISPAALQLAHADWLAHLALSPAKQAELVQETWRKLQRLATYLPHAASADAPRCIEPLRPAAARLAD